MEQRRARETWHGFLVLLQLATSTCREASRGVRTRIFEVVGTLPYVSHTKSRSRKAHRTAGSTGVLQKLCDSIQILNNVLVNFCQLAEVGLNFRMQN